MTPSQIRLGNSEIMDKRSGYLLVQTSNKSTHLTVAHMFASLKFITDLVN